VTALWLRLTALCGLADLAYALLAAQLLGGSVPGTLARVAAGPFGDAASGWGPAGALLGIAVHFALMAAMTGVGLVLAQRTILGQVAPWKAGTLYGLALYMLMYGLVLPWRFGVPFPNPDRLRLAIGLAPHVLLVGLPIFILTRQTLGPPTQANSADLRSS
jgi:hypothetical protein